MYMSRARLNLVAAKNSKFWQNLGNNYQIHNMIWSLFADKPERARDFMYRQEEINGFPTFYIVSGRKPDDQSGLWSVESKLYEPALRTDQKLSFVLRANPIVSKRDENGKQHRHDVIMDAKSQLKRDGISKDKYPRVSEIVQKKGVEWLQRKGQMNGFEIEGDQVRADGYQTQKLYKPKGKHHVNISTIDFTGVLTVTETELFKKALYYGVGPAKGFGCGLILVRPVR